jgi:hypothetical protein
VALIISGHTQALLDDGPGGGVLQVKGVLHILGHHGCACVEVRALGVRYDLKALLPHGVSPIVSRKECDRRRSIVSTDRALVQPIGHRHASVKNRNIPVLAEVEECVV